MLLHVFGCLLIDVLGVAATFVRELPSCLQHLGGGTNLMSGSVQHLPQKFDMTLFLAFGENICRHRRSFDPLEACLVTGQALLDHAELNSETLFLRRLTQLCWQRGEHLPFSCNRSPTRLLSFGDMFSYSARSHKSPQSSPYSIRTCLCVPDQWRKLHTQLQENFSQLVVSHACSKPALKQWRTHRAGCSDAHPWSHDHSWMIHQGGSPRPRLRPWAWKMMMAREVVLRDVIDEEHERNRMRHTSCAGILWRRDVRCGFRQHSSIAKSEAAVLTGLPIKFARKSGGWPAWDVHECGCCSWCWEFQSRRHRKKWWHWHNPPAEIQHRFGFAHQLVEAQKIMTIGVISFQRRCSALPSASSLDFVHRVSSIVQLEFTIPRDGFRRISL